MNINKIKEIGQVLIHEIKNAGDCVFGSVIHTEDDLTFRYCIGESGCFLLFLDERLPGVTYYNELEPINYSEDYVYNNEVTYREFSEKVHKNEPVKIFVERVTREVTIPRKFKSSNRLPDTNSFYGTYVHGPVVEWTEEKERVDIVTNYSSMREQLILGIKDFLQQVFERIKLNDEMLNKLNK